jgi:hypothetical protein
MQATRGGYLLGLAALDHTRKIFRTAERIFFSIATTVNAVADSLFLQDPISVLLFSCNATRQLVERIREREHSNSYVQSNLTHGDDRAMQFVTGEDKVLQKSWTIGLTCMSVSF